MSKPLGIARSCIVSWKSNAGSDRSSFGRNLTKLGSFYPHQCLAKGIWICLTDRIQSLSPMLSNFHLDMHQRRAEGNSRLTSHPSFMHMVHFPKYIRWSRKSTSYSYSSRAFTQSVLPNTESNILNPINIEHAPIWKICCHSLLNRLCYL